MTNVAHKLTRISSLGRPVRISAKLSVASIRNLDTAVPNKIRPIKQKRTRLKQNLDETSTSRSEQGEDTNAFKVCQMGSPPLKADSHGHSCRKKATSMIRITIVTHTHTQQLNSCLFSVPCIATIKISSFVGFEQVFCWYSKISDN